MKVIEKLDIKPGMGVMGEGFNISLFSKYGDAKSSIFCDDADGHLRDLEGWVQATAQKAVETTLSSLVDEQGMPYNEALKVIAKVQRNKNNLLDVLSWQELESMVAEYKAEQSKEEVENA